MTAMSDTKRHVSYECEDCEATIDDVDDETFEANGVRLHGEECGGLILKRVKWRLRA